MMKNILKLFLFLTFCSSYSQNSNVIILPESNNSYETLVAEHGSTLSVSWDVQIPQQKGNYIEYGFVKITDSKANNKKLSGGTDMRFETTPPKSVQSYKFRNLKYPLYLYNKKIAPGNYEVLINYRYYNAARKELVWGPSVSLPITIITPGQKLNNNSFQNTTSTTDKPDSEETQGAPINVIKKGKKITITSTDQIYSVMIYDTDGNEILFFNKTSNLKISKLFPGKYIAKASNGSKAEFTVD